ncbi:MAG TPA: hypothetical protein DCY03_28805 [Planctomycetaceae bacterium]|nr:hypothetical protein [Planctomycetaceae bacterium]|tara:strand:+ start:2555 stop:2974 length:420 start_codon:yes stop_codon:yes gene_type:complete
MSKHSDICEQLYASSLQDIKWQPFDREATLIFNQDNASLELRLRGVHLFCFRQSLSKYDEPFGKECHVQLVHIQQQNQFMSSFLNGELNFLSNVIIYDSSGVPQDHASFHNPQHLLIVCMRGDLDVICEEITLMNSRDE